MQKSKRVRGKIPATERLRKMEEIFNLHPSERLLLGIPDLSGLLTLKGDVITSLWKRRVLLSTSTTFPLEFSFIEVYQKVVRKRIKVEKFDRNEALKRLNALSDEYIKQMGYDK